MEARDEKQFEFSEWISEGFEGMLGSRPKVTPKLPREFREHSRAAFREMLLAYRSLLDAVIAKTEQEAEQPTAKIKVE